MMKKISLLLALGGLAFSHTLLAQDSPSSVSLPENIKVGRAPAKSSWSIVYGTTEKKEAASPLGDGVSTPQKPATPTYSVAKADGVHQVIETDSQGQRFERWYFDGATVTVDSDGRLVGAQENIFAKTDFPELNWINKQNFTGVGKFNGVDCFLFRGSVSMIEGGESGVEAALHAKTLLPLYFTQSGVLGLYRYGSPPSSLNVPPDVIALIKEQRAAMAPFLRHAASATE